VKQISKSPMIERGESERRFEQIVGDSRALESVLAYVEQVAPTDSTVLILGETGTGKELIARAIHKASSRADRPYIKLNCAALPFDLLESELFGHEKGAFTGAISQKLGRFEMADTGTLFLDEIGDLPLALQPKLLRVLQEQEFERLGSGRTHHINVRLVAATHRDLNMMVRRNEFRSDLYYRLNVFPIALPPLRQRREDIEQLVLHFIDIYSRRMNREIRDIPRETLDAFTAYTWPGNIRELQNLVERGVILSKDGIFPNPLPVEDEHSMGTATRSSGAFTDSQRAFTDSQRAFTDSQRALILRALEAAGWVIGGPHGAAARLGLKRTTLMARMRKFGISRPTFQDNLDDFLDRHHSEQYGRTAVD
jgi:formate hydrogenlyase transcriptional activator